MVFSGGTRVGKSRPSTGFLSPGLETVTSWTSSLLAWSSAHRNDAIVNESWTAAAHLLFNRVLQREPEKPRTRFEKNKNLRVRKSGPSPTTTQVNKKIHITHARDPNLNKTWNVQQMQATRLGLTRLFQMKIKSFYFLTIIHVSFEQNYFNVLHKLCSIILKTLFQAKNYQKLVLLP